MEIKNNYPYFYCLLKEKPRRRGSGREGDDREIIKIIVKYTTMELLKSFVIYINF